MRTAEELTAAAEAARHEAAAIAASAGVSDRAAGRLSASGLKQAHRSTDSQLRRYVEAQAKAESLEHKAALARRRETESARIRFASTDEIASATHVQDRLGWHEVVRINRKTVSVKTAYSWTDTIALDKILAAVVVDNNGNREIVKP